MQSTQNKPAWNEAIGESAASQTDDHVRAAAGYWAWDFSSGGVTWSDGLFRLLGLSPGSVRPSLRLWAKKVHSGDRRSAHEAAAAALKRGDIIDHEFRVMVGNGDVRWVANKGEVFPNSAGKPAWAEGVLFDITELRRSQEDIEQREERYRALTSLNAPGEWRAASDGQSIWAPFWAEFTGRDGSTFQDWLKSIHPDDIGGVGSLWAEMVRVGCSTELCFRARHFSGSYRWVRSRAVPIKNEDGSTREWVGSLEDVHACREESERLRLNEKLLQIALAAGRMVTWAYDLQGGIVTRSDNATELLGAGSGTFVEIVNSIRPEDRGRVLEAVARSLGTGKGFEIEYRTPSPAGGDRWLRSRGQLLRRPYAVDRHLIGVTLDVTSEKEAALERDESSEAVASLNARLHALRKVAGEFVWRASPDGRCIGDGSGWRAFTGQSREESDGWGWLGAVHPSDRQRIRNSVTQLFDSHKPGSYEFRLRSRSGHYRWVLSRAVPVLGPDGEPLEWLGSCTELRVPDAADDLGTRRNSQNDAFAMTGAQTRAARALLRWSIRDLAQRSGVSHSTIRRIEAEEGLSSSRDERMLRRVRSTLEEAGIFITLLPDGTSGVGLTSKLEAQLRNNQ